MSHPKGRSVHSTLEAGRVRKMLPRSCKYDQFCRCVAFHNGVLLIPQLLQRGRGLAWPRRVHTRGPILTASFVVNTRISHYGKVRSYRARRPVVFCLLL